MRTVAVLPVKSFARAKQRIAGALSSVDRPVLAEAMVRDVLAALERVDGLDAVVVVTGEPRARVIALDAGATIVDDHREAGQSAAAGEGIEAAMAGGAHRVLLVPGDCPALDPGEVARLLAAQGADGVVIVPDRHGSGTNALLLSPPDAIRPSFGPGSFARHAALARARGAQVRVAQIASLGLDVDTPGDLTALRTALEARAGGATHTRAALDKLAPSLSPS
jgi:2-phospho-L-lactate guanylyltransferase